MTSTIKQCYNIAVVRTDHTTPHRKEVHDMSRKKKKSSNQNNSPSAKDVVNLIAAIVNAVRSIIDLINRFTE